MVTCRFVFGESKNFKKYKYHKYSPSKSSKKTNILTEDLHICLITYLLHANKTLSDIISQIKAVYEQRFCINNTSGIYLDHLLNTHI